MREILGHLQNQTTRNQIGKNQIIGAGEGGRRDYQKNKNKTKPPNETNQTNDKTGNTTITKSGRRGLPELVKLLPGE